MLILLIKVLGFRNIYRETPQDIVKVRCTDVVPNDDTLVVTFQVKNYKSLETLNNEFGSFTQERYKISEVDIIMHIKYEGRRDATVEFDQKDDEDGIEPQYPQSKNNSIKRMHMGLDNLQLNKKRDPSANSSGDNYGTLISGLDNLRKSHEEGILSDLEFQLAKEKLLLEN